MTKEEKRGKIKALFGEVKQEDEIVLKWFWKRIGNKEKTPATAVLYIDYGYWYETYRRMYQEKPNILKLQNKLEQQYYVKEIIVFADLTKYAIERELENTEKVAYHVVDTHQDEFSRGNFMTEFIILNYLYQCEIENPQTTSYIFFSNSECFCPAIKFLRQRKKEIIVLGVRNVLSPLLKNAASKTIEIPSLEESQNKYFYMIVKNLNYVSNRPEIIPTFRTTVKAVARYNNVSEIKIHMALEEMIKNGLVIQRTWTVEPGKTIKVIDADWGKVSAAGLN